MGIKAAIDIGTNSTRFLMVDEDSAGVIHPVIMREHITMLGQGVDVTRALATEAMERVFKAVDEYMDLCQKHSISKVVIFATSATRDASNSLFFLKEISKRTHLIPRVLSGEEEAYYSFQGAISDQESDQSYLVCDIGGGSTEFIFGDKNSVVKKNSLDIGSLRLTEKFIHHDPPTTGELKTLEAFLHQQMITYFTPPWVTRAIFVGGTATTLAMMDGQFDLDESFKAHKYILKKQRLEKMIRLLKKNTLTDLRKIRGLPAARAPVILSGGIILTSVMKHFHLEDAQVSLRDVLFGILLDKNRPSLASKE